MAGISNCLNSFRCVDEEARRAQILFHSMRGGASSPGCFRPARVSSSMSCTASVYFRARMKRGGPRGSGANLRLEQRPMLRRPAAVALM